jgi:hypothetical protein
MAPHFAPRRLRILAGRKTQRRLAKLRLRDLEFPLTNTHERIQWQVDELLCAIAPGDRVATDHQIARGARDKIALEPRHVCIHLRLGHRQCPGERIHQGRATLIRERQHNICREHPRCPLHHRRTALGEQLWRIAQVRSRCGQQAGDAGQFADDPTHAHRRRRIGHRHEVVHPIRKHRRIQHRIAAPVLQRLLFQQPPVDHTVEDLLIDAFVRRQRRCGERAQLSTRAFELSDLTSDGRGGVVVECAVEVVDAVARRNRRMATGEVLQVAIDKRAERRGLRASSRDRAINRTVGGRTGNAVRSKRGEREQHAADKRQIKGP